MSFCRTHGGRRALMAGTFLSGCLAVGALAAPATAQSGEDDALVQDRILVTARKIQEDIQDAPLSVTAFSEEAIREAGIGETADFIALTSNVTLAESQSISTAFLTIRGLTQVRNGEMPVAVIVDDVLQFNNRQFVGQLFDVAQIEVVKGPQGALYGRNATGGAIIINTKAPGNETEGYFGLGVGNGEEMSAEGSVSVPLIEDQLFAKLSGRVVSREGYYTNVTRNDTDDPYFDRALRGRLLWTPSDDLTLDLIGNFGRHNGRGIGFQFGAAGADDTSLPFVANNEDVGERQTQGISLRIEKELDWATLTSVTAWDQLTSLTRADQFPYSALANGVDTVPFGDGTQSQYTDMESWSQEVRLTSAADGPLRWQVGAYYLDWERFISSTVGTDLGKGIKRVERTPFLTDATNPTVSFFADDNDNDAWAVFGQLSYDITDQLELNIAGRYDEEKRRQAVSPLNTSGVPGASNKATFDKFSPKVTLRYMPHDTITLYGSWGEGFRSGQFNQNGTAAAAQTAGIQGVQDIVDQEESQSWELGFKTDLFNDRLRLNGAYFDTKVEGQQYFVFIGDIGAQVLLNIDEVDIDGFELEAIWRAVDGLDLYAAYGQTNSKVKAYTTDPSLVGNKAPYVPDETFNAGFQWTAGLNPDFDLVTRVDYERRGEQFWSPDNTAPRSPLDLVNARVALQKADGQWELALEAKNLTDESYNSEFVLPAFSHKANPRSVRAKLRYNF
jgi:iron complex outermembrane receptor protein